MLARRSCLSVPGSSQSMLAKAPELGADEVVLDLEDSVAPEAKQEARSLVAGALDGAPAAVRINGLASAWWRDDVDAVGGLAGSLVVPKVEGPEDLERVARRLDALGEPAGGTRLQALIETARGLQHVGEIAAASARLDTLILGYLDLAASLGRPLRQDEPGRWLHAQETLLVAARASGRQAIDGPHLAVDDEAGLLRAAEHARALGYDGKWAIHPAQVPVLNSTFSPRPEELERAQAVLDALAEAEAGVLEAEGQMLDEASRKHALGVLARGTAGSE
jgi:citrate lyase subunit beta/citryl-CoA lyase